jgi:hypothetical protein
VGEELPEDFLPENNADGIVVYRDRRPSVHQGLFMLLLAGGCFAAAAAAFLPPFTGAAVSDPGGSLAVYGLFGGGSGALAIATFVRALRNRPTLVVNGRGILDGSSGQGKIGRKLYRWDEIASVGCEVRGNDDYAMQSLVINIFHTPKAAARAVMNVVPSPTAPAPFSTTAIHIYQSQFAISAIELAYAIEMYITIAAPPGWHGVLSGEKRDLVTPILMPDLPDLDPAH